MYTDGILFFKILILIELLPSLSLYFIAFHSVFFSINIKENNNRNVETDGTLEYKYSFRIFIRIWPLSSTISLYIILIYGEINNQKNLSKFIQKQRQTRVKIRRIFLSKKQIPKNGIV